MNAERIANIGSTQRGDPKVFGAWTFLYSLVTRGCGRAALPNGAELFRALLQKLHS